MSKAPSIVDYAEARAGFARQLSDLAFGDAPAVDAARAAHDSAETMRSFRSAPRCCRSVASAA